MSICLTFSNIDWAITKDVFSIIGTISAVVIGIIGLTTWRRQLKGTSEYEVAKKAILHTYEVEQTIQGVRHPMLHLPKDKDNIVLPIVDRQYMSQLDFYFHTLIVDSILFYGNINGYF
ncbi:hypothetical protein RS130_08405 [Paraglaciecola aquimarina]|uniref:Uncharacterized protein n=1 Tax=Paraglaciecola aquimarina TaxID=1235557 RepID=A0ABU3SVC4_9ALTE|nr:hypothetical protein [Paraglaciecola aquimarina]MDU0353947.1 hypothetical protein [Paraglaciecola aquimarina]